MSASLTYLLVDDDAADLELLRFAFSSLTDVSDVIALSDAGEALEWFGSRIDSDLAGDVVVVTDLKMPVLDGPQLVAEFRSRWEHSPVTIVVSTSERRQDVERAYEAGAHAYHVKPMSYHGTAELCRSIDSYWRTATRPRSTSVS